MLQRLWKGLEQTDASLVSFLTSRVPGPYLRIVLVSRFAPVYSRSFVKLYDGRFTVEKGIPPYEEL
jgi:hypothetical protein